MKQKAIISLLWANQFEALRQFLMMHEPMTVIAPAGAIGSELQTVVASTGSALVSLDSLLPPHRVQSLAAESERMQGEFHRYLSAWQNDETAAEGDSGALSSIVEERLASDLPRTVTLLECLKEAANRFDIALFVTSEDVTGVGKVATGWAKARGIPSLHLSHSVALIDPYTVHNQVIADKLAVFGKRGMEGYQDLGFPDERMILTGNPAWDCYADLRDKKVASRQQLNQKYRLKPGLPLVVFGTTWSANLSAHCNEEIFSDTVMVFLATCELLRKSGVEFNAAIKDRASDRAFGERRCKEIVAELGIVGGHYLYCVDDTRQFAAAADVLIAVDSNYLVEGMLARTPVINLMNVTGVLMGPCFEAEAGVLDAEPHELADAIRVLLTDGSTRESLLALARARVGHYNHSDGDGMAATRVAQAMASMTTLLPKRTERFVWQRYLDVESAEVAASYHTVGRPDLAAMYTNKPELILDIGCAAGSTAELIKQRFPGSRAWGIEMNRGAATLAQAKLDRVLIGKFEDFDLEHEGVAHGTLDAVLLADVLEHMYNPWDVMVKLRPYMSPTGQLVLSIPNVRNLLLMDELSKGNWTYAGEGLLDITHIRFFTIKEILKFCRETGYRVLRTQNAIDLRLQGLWKQHENTAGPINVELNRLTLKAVTREELVELCTVQFHVLLERDS